MEVSKEKLRENLLANAEFGKIATDEGYGRTVLTGSQADKNARDYLVNQLEMLGMDVSIDCVGNISGRWVPESAQPDLPPVVAGSHLDSVPNGGIFDGPLGVYGAVEAVRSIRQADIQLERPVEVVSFTEEEGQRFGIGVLGSSVACGQRSPEEAFDFEDESGLTLKDHLEKIGFHGEGRLDASNWDAFLELHIEQSTQLENAGVSVGIVTAITGVSNCHIEIYGESNHAGGTRMKDRTDALVAASEFIQDVNRTAHEMTATESSFAVATIGEISIEPNARNVIPGEARLTTDFRDVEMDVMDELVDRANKSLKRIEAEYGVETNLERYRTMEPVEMSDRCMRAFEEACKNNAINNIELPSGGGHDAMKIGDVTDVGMIFALSRGGISHSPNEWTDWDDCARTTQILADGMVHLAGAGSH